MSAASNATSPATGTAESPCLADALPASEHIVLRQTLDAEVAAPPADEDTVYVVTHDGRTRCAASRAGLLKYSNVFCLMCAARGAASDTPPLAEWRLADPVTATAGNIALFASWISYYGAAPERRVPTCVTYPIFLGPVDYVIEPADYLFIEHIVLERKGLADAGAGGIMRLISLGEFAAAVDCGVLRDICVGYIAARIREADDAYVEGVGPTASAVVRTWFGKTGDMTDAQFEAAKARFGAALSGADWQEMDRRAQGSQAAAGILPSQPY